MGTPYQTLALILLLTVLVVLLLAFLLFKYRSQTKKLETRYSKVIDIDTEVEKSKQEKVVVDSEINKLRESYKQKKAIFDQLAKEAAIYDEEIQLAELGFYKPHFDFDTSERYKEEISKTKAEQKRMLSDKTAVYCTMQWEVHGSKAKGTTMTNRGIRLTARAFNNECDAALSNVRWNNKDRMEQRLEKAFDAINKLNESNEIHISHEYLELKLKELRLAHEYADKKQKEKEEQAEIRAQMREEAKLQQEVENTLREEDKFKNLLERAHMDATKAAGDKLAKLQQTINELNFSLEAAHEKSERAKSMAQQTKRGHVYVISNVGSFGINVYKIGMTRRLDPTDRVKELGDASVPFIFDVHAMIHSDDAPALESALHNSFDSRRVNLVNNRKEFFNVGLKEIEAEVNKVAPEAEFIQTIEARDYRESQSIRAQQKKMADKQDTISKFPEAI